jgi:cell division initiation protein
MTGEYEEVQKQAQIFRTRMRTMLQAQLDMLNAAEEDEDN